MPLECSVTGSESRRTRGQAGLPGDSGQAEACSMHPSARKASKRGRPTQGAAAQKPGSWSRRVLRSRMSRSGAGDRSVWGRRPGSGGAVGNSIEAGRSQPESS